jgi:hypothetical protein
MQMLQVLIILSFLTFNIFLPPEKVTNGLGVNVILNEDAINFTCFGYIVPNWQVSGKFSFFNGLAS